MMSIGNMEDNGNIAVNARCLGRFIYWSLRFDCGNSGQNFSHELIELAMLFFVFLVGRSDLIAFGLKGEKSFGWTESFPDFGNAYLFFGHFRYPLF